MKNELTLGKSILYYFCIWFLGTVLLGIAIIITGWIYVTPAVVSPLLDRIPPFDFVMEDGLLTKTGLSSEPFEYNMGGFQLFISSTLTEIPTEKKGTPGIFILRDHALVDQTENTVNKSQSVIYADSPELKNFHVNNAIAKVKILEVLPQIKKALAYIIIFSLLLIATMISVWYLIFSFFWALIVSLVSKVSHRHPLTYEQSLSFVLSTFFPVVGILIIIGLVNWIFPFYSRLIPVISFILLKIGPLIALFAACGYGWLLGLRIMGKGQNFHYPFGSIFLIGLTMGLLGIAMNGSDFMSISFTTTLLFLLMLGYNHLSFYSQSVTSQ